MFGIEDEYLNTKYGIPTTGEPTSRKDEIAKVHEFRKILPRILEKNYEQYIRHYNKNRKELFLTEGDMVLLKINKPTKMMNSFEGPYKIIKILSKSALIIERNGEKRVVHTSKIKPYYARGNKDEE
jgi:hypothetical protein